MAAQRLFERLLTGATQHNLVSTSFDITESIRSHVAQLLSTRQGDALICPDLGLPDLNMSHMTPHDAIIHVKREVKRVIHHYEKRITNIKVNYLGDIHSPLHLYFDVQGDITLNGKCVPISFTTHAQTSGQKSIHHNMQGAA
jgi:type VI secretion system protein